MLKIENLNKNLQIFQLKNINMHIPKGYICGLIGENGAGKSSLIKTITDMYRRDSGRVFVDGMEFDENEAAVKDILGLVADWLPYDEGLSALATAKTYGGLYSRFDMNLFLEYLDRFRVPKDKKIKKLSRGMKTKFQLALALSHGAELFLFDEPTAGFDTDFRAEFLNICMDIISDGRKTILFSTHLTKDLDRAADYIAFMQNGELLFTESKEKLLDRFMYVQAENYKLKLIPKNAVVYASEGAYGGSALVANSRRIVLDEAYEKRQPTIGELMYGFVKGGQKHAEDIVKEYL